MKPSRQPAWGWVLGGALAGMAFAGGGQAGVAEILDALEASEFRFMRGTSEVPFMPLGWVADRYYSPTRFEAEHGDIPSAQVAENRLSAGGVIPPYVGRRDMLLLGGDISWDHLAVDEGPYHDQSILRITPLTGWVHQFGEDDAGGAFVAPVLTRELDRDTPWTANGYAGVIGVHWFSDTLQVLYGAVGEYRFGRYSLYPYAGAQWLPSPRWSVSLVFPWPTVTYAPGDRWLIQCALSPGGTSWTQRGADQVATESLDSWDLSGGVGYRLGGPFWLYAGGGIAGLRGVHIQTGERQTRLLSEPGPFVTLAIQLRP